MEPVLSCANLAKRFGDRRAVDGVTFTIAPGEIYGMLGPNGAGKTTTIKLICGLLAPDEGTVAVEGRDARTTRSVRSHIGYVPQDVALYPDLTARENLNFLGRLYGMRGATLRARVDEALELTDLADREGDRVESFSGGMRRRLNLSAGLLNHPELLVLDEPTVGVDPQSRHAILERVRLLASGGMAVLYTTHYMEEAERLCDRVGIIDRGRIVAEGSRRDLVAQLGERDHILLGAIGDLAGLACAIRGLPGVVAASVGDECVEVVVEDGRSALPAIVEIAQQRGDEVRSVDVREPDLEAVFLHLTGTALRE